MVSRIMRTGSFAYLQIGFGGRWVRLSLTELKTRVVSQLSILVIGEFGTLVPLLIFVLFLYYSRRGPRNLSREQPVG
jgi:hypothetical protein